MKFGFFGQNWLVNKKPAGGIVSGTGMCISWQNGPFGKVDGDEDVDPNGAFVEDVISATHSRVNFYTDHGCKCEEYDDVLKYLEAALICLSARDKRLADAGTEGTHEGK